MKVTLGLEMLLKGKYCLVEDGGIDLNVFCDYHLYLMYPTNVFYHELEIDVIYYITIL